VSVGSDDGLIDHLTLMRDCQTVLCGQLTELFMGEAHDYRMRIIIKRPGPVSTEIVNIVFRVCVADCRHVPVRIQGFMLLVPLPWTPPVVVRLPSSSTLCDETRDACFHHFIEFLPGVDIRPQSILEPVGISSALKGFRRPRNHLDWAKRCPRFSSTPVLFPPAH